jgi:2-dehydropantoate 2-reductase
MSLKVGVMGAGAIGCHYGGLLAQAGVAVTLVARAAHVQAIRSGGLRWQSAGVDRRIALAAATEVSALQACDLVLVTVKSGDTLAVARQLAETLQADCLVLSLQNGVENADRLRQVLQQPVAAVVAYVAVEMAGPGHVLHRGRGELQVEVLAMPGARARLEALVQALRAAGVAVTLTEGARAAQWNKLVVNCAYNALSALLQQPYGQIVQRKGVPELMRTVVAECQQVAAAEGIRLAPELQQVVEALALSMPGQYSSTAQDLARGKPSEIDDLNGAIVRAGRRHGIATPVNQALLTLVQALEASQTH